MKMIIKFSFRIIFSPIYQISFCPQSLEIFDKRTKKKLKKFTRSTADPQVTDRVSQFIWIIELSNIRFPRHCQLLEKKNHLL